MFSTIWACTLAGFTFLLVVPVFLRFVAALSSRKRGISDVWGEVCNRVVGVREEWGVDEDDVDEAEREVASGAQRQSVLRRVENVLGRFKAVFFWTVPGLGLNAGQSESL